MEQKKLKTGPQKNHHSSTYLCSAVTAEKQQLQANSGRRGQTTVERLTELKESRSYEKQLLVSHYKMKTTYMCDFYT